MTSNSDDKKEKNGNVMNYKGELKLQQKYVILMEILAKADGNQLKNNSFETKALKHMSRSLYFKRRGELVDMGYFASPERDFFRLTFKGIMEGLPKFKKGIKPIDTWKETKEEKEKVEQDVNLGIIERPMEIVIIQCNYKPDEEAVTSGPATITTRIDRGEDDKKVLHEWAMGVHKFAHETKKEKGLKGLTTISFGVD